MKTKKYILIALLIPLLFVGCKVNDYYYYDYDPPAPPSGLSVLNGDQRVDLSWDANRDDDLAGYNVYYSYDYDGEYYLLGSTKKTMFVDYGASNGVKYYYAVAAYDFNGNESDLSYDLAYATPRPEGFNQIVFDYLNFPNNSGYSFRKYKVVPYDHLDADFFFENYNGTYYLDVWDDTDIRDMGKTVDIWDIPEAPLAGWSPTKDVIAQIGHTYVIWTWDNHFAKIRVSNITPERIVFDWAYQTVEGNPQLKNGKNLTERKTLNRSWIR